MAHSSFGTGWPNCQPANMVVLVRSDGFRRAFHRSIVDLMQQCLDVTEALGYDVKPDQSWGYSCRAVAGTNSPSNHSWGTAVDINARENPRRVDRRFQSNLPADVVRFWEGVGFRWGGRWSWPDPMHFDWPGTAAEAQRKAADLRAYFAALGGKTPPPAQPSGFPGAWAGHPCPGTVRMGDEGPAVQLWQRLLIDRGYAIGMNANNYPDGVFGPVTNHAVWHWQSTHASQGLVADSIAGPATWHSLIYS